MFAWTWLHAYGVSFSEITAFIIFVYWIKQHGTTVRVSTSRPVS